MKIVKSWATTMDDVVEVFQGEDGQYHWRVEAAGNHEKVGGGEGHPDVRDAITAAERHHPPVTSEQ